MNLDSQDVLVIVYACLNQALRASKPEQLLPVIRASKIVRRELKVFAQVEALNSQFLTSLSEILSSESESLQVASVIELVREADAPQLMLDTLSKVHSR